MFAGLLRAELSTHNSKFSETTHTHTHNTHASWCVTSYCRLRDTQPHYIHISNAMRNVCMYIYVCIYFQSRVARICVYCVCFVCMEHKSQARWRHDLRCLRDSKKRNEVCKEKCVRPAAFSDSMRAESNNIRACGALCGIGVLHFPWHHRCACKWMEWLEQTEILLNHIVLTTNYLRNTHNNY